MISAFLAQNPIPEVRCRRVTERVFRQAHRPRLTVPAHEPISPLVPRRRHYSREDVGRIRA
jgi:hypothetical protein